MAFSVPANKPVLPAPVTSGDNTRTNAGFFSRLRSRISARFVYVQDFVDELRARDIHSRIEAQRLREEPQISQAELASAVFQSSTGDAEKGSVQPDAVRFAVLVAMPDPSRPSSAGDMQHQDREADASSSSSSLKGKGRGSFLQQRETDEESEMPYIEFGVTEVGLKRSSGP